MGSELTSTYGPFFFVILEPALVHLQIKYIFKVKHTFCVTQKKKKLHLKEHHEGEQMTECSFLDDYPINCILVKIKLNIIKKKKSTALIVIYNNALIGRVISKATSYCLNTMLCCNAGACLINP